MCDEGEAHSINFNPVTIFQLLRLLLLDLILIFNIKEFFLLIKKYFILLLLLIEKKILAST